MDLAKTSSSLFITAQLFSNASFICHSLSRGLYFVPVTPTGDFLIFLGIPKFFVIIEWMCSIFPKVIFLNSLLFLLFYVLRLLYFLLSIPQFLRACRYCLLFAMISS